MIKKEILDKRLIHYDLMRVIACFCVIMIHSCVYEQSKDWSNQSMSLMASSFYGIISRWAVPCFVMISGMMFLNNNKELPLKKLYGKYILRLFVSYVFWSCIYAIYNSFYETSGGLFEQAKYFVNNFLSGETHMWYVLMTIGLYIAVPIIKFVMNNAPKKIIKYWIVIMFVFASVIPFVSELGVPMLSNYIAYLNKYIDIQFLCGYTIYFVLGSYISKYDLSAKVKKIIYALGVLSFLYAFFILIVLKYFINSNLGALSYFYPNIIFMGVAVMLFFKEKISKINFSTKSRAVIFQLSKLSYGIFLIHILVLKVLYHFGMTIAITNAFISIPLISLLSFIIAAIIIYPISKIPFINRYVC